MILVEDGFSRIECEGDIFVFAEFLQDELGGLFVPGTASLPRLQPDQSLVEIKPVGVVGPSVVSS